METDHSLSTHTGQEMKQELNEGLRIFVETAWGWSEVKAAPFVKQVIARGGRVTAYCEVRRGGGLTLKVPRRV